MHLDRRETAPRVRMEAWRSNRVRRESAPLVSLDTAGPSHGSPLQRPVRLRWPENPGRRCPLSGAGFRCSSEGEEKVGRWDHRQAVALFIFVITTCPFRNVTAPAGYVHVSFSS